MHRILPGLLTVLCALAAFPGTAQAEYFTITSFAADILVQQDSSFQVRETIETEFTSQRHGIFRDLPFRYADELGKKLRTPLAVLSVTDDQGRAWKYSLSRLGDTMRIMIGHPKKFIEGRQVFVITYRVENAILFLGDRDELYWNVTGNRWEVPMARVSATASVAGSGPLALKARCYTGAFGSREEACDFAAGERGGVFRAARALNPGEGFTIALGWDKGVVHPPSALRRFFWSLNAGQNWVFLIPLASLVFMYRHWRLKGKDPDVGDTVAVAYAPPEEKGRALVAAEVGALADGKLDARDLTASIVGLAVKGHLAIAGEKTPGILFSGTDYCISPTGKADAELTRFEQLLLKDLLGSAPSVLVSELKYKFYAHLGHLKDEVYNELKRLGYYTANPESVKARYVGGGFAVAAVVILPGLFLANLVGMNWGRVVLAGILTALPVFAFAPVMPARTRKGALAWLKVRGFEEFLSRAERDRLERMADKNLFEKYLPYAIALDVSGRWAKAFEGITQEPPRWYTSPGGIGAFQPASFNHSLGGALSTMGSAMYAAPRSSGSGGGGGSSGGGSSGGGFGGGGGGSW